MKSVTYRSSTIFNRVILTGGFVLVSILLIMAGLNEDEAIFNGIHYLLAGIVGVPYFGRYFILYIVLLLRDNLSVRFRNGSLVPLESN